MQVHVLSLVFIVKVCEKQKRGFKQGNTKHRNSEALTEQTE